MWHHIFSTLVESTSVDQVSVVMSGLSLKGQGALNGCPEDKTKVQQLLICLECFFPFLGY